VGQFLITGGAGFIGSHVVLLLLEAGHRVVVLDNYANSSAHSLQRVLRISEHAGSGQLHIIEGDIRRSDHLEQAFNAFTASSITAVMHFAGLKAVGESVQDPLGYWDVNFCGSHQLLSAMRAHSCRTIVFSSSCTVYGTPHHVPITEADPIRPINPYGHSKAAVEQLLADVAASEAGWRIASLRYFNPVGAHPSGQIGEDPTGIPNNLFPFVGQVAVGRRTSLQVFGGTWDTPDGTCIRDYIHVMDLAEAHRAAFETLLAEEPQLLTLNLGTGKGYSVLDVIAAFEQVCGRSIPYQVVDRRFGDVAITFADPALAERRLGWRAQRGLKEMCLDAWAWQTANPNGYSS